MEAITTSSLAGALLTAAAILFTVQALYYLLLYNRIIRRNRAAQRGELHFTAEQAPISVIIYARDEAENLRRNLPAVLAQDYPQFEVIVITDSDKDECADYLTQLEGQYPNLYHSFIPDSSRYISRKKLAVTLGIRASKYDWMVLTEPDCLPQSNRWLQLLARNFTTRTQVVLGYSGYDRGRGWLARNAAFDTLFSAMRYLGWALARSPYMGIGRNLAYRKEAFYAHKGFSAHLNLLRGDDDLFVNGIADAENTRVETDPDAAVRRRPPFRAKEWREEKTGYASTAPLCRGLQRYFSGFETFSRLAFHAAWAGACVAAIVHAHWLTAALALLLFLLRFALQAGVINCTARTLREPYRYRLTLPLFDLLQPLQALRRRLHCLLGNKSEFLRK